MVISGLFLLWHHIIVAKPKNPNWFINNNTGTRIILLGDSKHNMTYNGKKYRACLKQNYSIIDDNTQQVEIGKDTCLIPIQFENQVGFAALIGNHAKMKIMENKNMNAIIDNRLHIITIID